MVPDGAFYPDGAFHPFYIEKVKISVFDHPGGPRGSKFLVVASLGLSNPWLIDGAPISLQFSGWCLMVPDGAFYLQPKIVL